MVLRYDIISPEAGILITLRQHTLSGVQPASQPKGIGDSPRETTGRSIKLNAHLQVNNSWSFTSNPQYVKMVSIFGSSWIFSAYFCTDYFIPLNSFSWMLEF